jgi:hypothetical protein
VHNAQIRNTPDPQRTPAADPGDGNPVNPEDNNGEGETHQPNCRNRRAADKRSKKNTKAAICVASLNIKGWRAKDAPQSKWNEINQMMREKHIGILLVQEAHLNEARKEGIENLFKKSMKVYHSEDLTNPTGKGGVAVVLNRQLTNVNGVQITEIIPGRVIHVRTNWHREVYTRRTIRWKMRNSGKT